MAAKYRDEAERWKRRLEESEAVNARLRQELAAVQRVYSAGAAAAAANSVSAAASCMHLITPPPGDSLDDNRTAD